MTNFKCYFYFLISHFAVSLGAIVQLNTIICKKTFKVLRSWEAALLLIIYSKVGKEIIEEELPIWKTKLELRCYYFIAGKLLHEIVM